MEKECGGMLPFAVENYPNYFVFLYFSLNNSQMHEEAEVTIYI